MDRYMFREPHFGSEWGRSPHNHNSSRSCRKVYGLCFIIIVISRKLEKGYPNRDVANHSTGGTVAQSVYWGPVYTDPKTMHLEALSYHQNNRIDGRLSCKMIKHLCAVSLKTDRKIFG